MPLSFFLKKKFIENLVCFLPSDISLLQDWVSSIDYIFVPVAFYGLWLVSIQLNDLVKYDKISSYGIGSWLQFPSTEMC